MDKKICRKIANKWDQVGERILLKIWAEKMSQLRNCRKNSHILLEMASEMETKGLGYTAREIKIKMQNLTSRYRKERMKIVSTGGSPSEWDLYKAMEDLLAPYQSYNSEHSIADSIKNINSSIVTDPLSSALNAAALFPSIHESTTSSLNPPDSPLSCGSSDSSSSNISFPAAKRKKKEFDNFFENLEQTMHKINEDLKTTIEKIITIEEEKRDILKIFVEKEGEVQEALLAFLRRN